MNLKHNTKALQELGCLNFHLQLVEGFIKKGEDLPKHTELRKNLEIEFSNKVKELTV